MDIGSSWESIKLLIVDYSETIVTTTKSFNTDNSEKRREEAYIAELERRNRHYCLEAGHISRNCPLRALHYKTKGSDFVDQHSLHQRNNRPNGRPLDQDNPKEKQTHYEPKKTTAGVYGAVKCIRCHGIGHLSPACPNNRQNI